MNKKICRAIISLLATGMIWAGYSKNVQASPLVQATFEKVIAGEITSEETEDAYSFSVPKSGRVILLLELSLSSTEITLEDSKGVMISENVLQRGTVEKPYKQAYVDLEPGVYTMKVKKYNEVTGKYNFKLSFIEAGSNNKEPNNQLGNAESVIVNGEVKKGFLAWNDDKDIYKLIIDKNQVININIIPYMKALEMEILDAQGNLIAYDEMHNEKDNQFNSWRYNFDVEAGTYYLSFNKLEEATGEFHFKINSSKGWVESVDNKWVYYNPQNGEMVTGWQLINGKWYFLEENGLMQTGWINQKGKWYYLNNDGSMKTGWLQEGGKWYYLTSSGEAKTGWGNIGGKWYFFNLGGDMVTGWKSINGKWYYFNQGGSMDTGWVKVGANWYYLEGSGAMKTGWIILNSKWFYLYEDGRMAANTIIGGYKLGADGAWVK